MNLAFGNEVVERHGRILATWQSFKDWQSLKGYDAPSFPRSLIGDVMTAAKLVCPIGSPLGLQVW